MNATTKQKFDRILNLEADTRHAYAMWTFGSGDAEIYRARKERMMQAVRALDNQEFYDFHMYRKAVTA